MTVGEKIRKRRLELGLTQEELAEKLGYKSRSSINKIELARDLPADKIKKIADILDLSISYLMGWESPQVDYTISVPKFEEHIELIENYDKLDTHRKSEVLDYIKYLLSKSNEI